MRHNLAHRKFNRTTNQRKALLSNLAVQLIQKERITTTLPKAKEIRPFVEKLVSQGKRSSSSSYHSLYRKLKNKEAVVKLMSTLSSRCAERNGGYLRIIKAGFRYGDQAPMAIIEFVDFA